MPSSWLVVDYNLGTDYTWNPGHPVAVGGTLTFKGESVALGRTQSDVSATCGLE